MQQTTKTVAVSRDDLDEAVSILDGLASALAMARRDWNGEASQAAEAVARIGDALRAGGAGGDVGGGELAASWRETLVGAFASGLDSRISVGYAITGMATEAS